MRVPNTTQVPLYEPIYANGVLSQVWVMFFQKLAQLANNTDANGDILELIQLANQLPSGAQQAQQGYDIATMQDIFSTTAIHTNQDIETPPIQAVFLYPDVVMPICALHVAISPMLPYLPLPSSEILHD